MSDMKKRGISVSDAFSRVAFWQVMAFVFLLCFVWANEIFDFAYLLFNIERRPFHIYRGFLLSGGVITAGIIAIGHTYEKQRAVVAKLLKACFYCHRVKSDKGSWVHVEEYFMKHFPVSLSREICPECHEMLEKVDERLSGVSESDE